MAWKGEVAPMGKEPGPRAGGEMWNLGAQFYESGRSKREREKKPQTSYRRESFESTGRQSSEMPPGLFSGS